MGWGVDKSDTTDHLDSGEKQWTAEREHHQRNPAMMAAFPHVTTAQRKGIPETGHQSVQQTL